jgi:hypothetical protein
VDVDILVHVDELAGMTDSDETRRNEKTHARRIGGEVRRLPAPEQLLDRAPQRLFGSRPIGAAGRRPGSGAVRR